MRRKILTLMISLVLITGCRKPTPKLDAVPVENLPQALDNLCFEILQESTKYGYKKLFIPALAATERRQGFVGEEFLSRLYTNRRLNVITLYELADLKKKAALPDFSSTAQLPPSGRLTVCWKWTCSQKMTLFY